MASRDLESVIADLLGVIPESETDLRAKLNHVLRAWAYRAPEIAGVSWSEAQEALFEAIGDEPDLDSWHRQALSIWCGRPVP